MQWEADQKERLDRFLARQMPAHSRTKIVRLIEDLGVLVDGESTNKPSLVLKAGQTVSASEPGEPAPQALAPIEMDLEVPYEDEHLLVVNKPRGLPVHPAPSVKDAPTLVHALLARSHSLSTEGGDFRPGIVHRLDKETTGLLMVAKSDAVHRALAGQIQARSAGRRYFAVVKGDMKEARMAINLPLGRHPSNPTLRAVRTDGKEAVTHILTLARLERGTLAACRLETGRTHQIRVHLAAVGHSVIGDHLYAPRPHDAGPLQLHAAWLSFVHPITHEPVTVFSAPPDDFAGAALATRVIIEQWKV